MSDPSLSAVCHAIVKKAPNGVPAETISSLLGYRTYFTMMSELSRQPNHKLGADKVLPIMDLTDSDEPLHFLARERGGVFVKLPPVTEGGEPVQLACLHAVKEFGELCAQVGESLTNGAISRDELDDITREGQEAVTAIMALLKVVRETGGRS